MSVIFNVILMILFLFPSDAFAEHVGQRQLEIFANDLDLEPIYGVIEQNGISFSMALFEDTKGFESFTSELNIRLGVDYTINHPTSSSPFFLIWSKKLSDCALCQGHSHLGLRSKLLNAITVSEIFFGNDKRKIIALPGGAMSAAIFNSQSNPEYRGWALAKHQLSQKIKVQSRFKVGRSELYSHSIIIDGAENKAVAIIGEALEGNDFVLLNPLSNRDLIEVGLDNKRSYIRGEELVYIYSSYVAQFNRTVVVINELRNI